MKTDRTLQRILLGIMLLLGLALIPCMKARAADGYYVDAVDDGSGAVVYTKKSLAEVDCTEVVSGAGISWGETETTKWYVVNSNVTITGRISVAGNVRLILFDGCELEVPKGITVSGDSNSFTVYAGGTADTIEGTGKLKITGAESDNAGIGGGNGGVGSAGGNITINGGTVTATGGGYAAGIGGGDEGAGSKITINGGKVIAIGGIYGAGIGGGSSGAGSNITINGGTVTAIGGECGAGIGGGSSGAGSNITINGGTVTATGGLCGAGIGGGGSSGAGSDITINGGTVTATGGDYAAGIGGGSSGAGNNISISADTFVFAKADASGSYALISNGSAPVTQDDLKLGEEGNFSYQYVRVINNRISFKSPKYYSEGGIIIDPVTGEPQFDNVLLSTVLNNADNEVVLLTDLGTTWGTVGKTTWYIADGTINIGLRVTVAGDVRLILFDGCELEVTKGITVSGVGNSFTVYAGGTADTIEGTGKLKITGAESGNAGIGGGDEGAGSNITINGGKVTAKGGDHAAGIGGGAYGAGSNITINGGTVTATGGRNAAGIGGGELGDGSKIKINGGTVTATGGIGGVGIGGGTSGTGSDISISNCIIKAGDSAAEGQIIPNHTVTGNDISDNHYVFATPNPYTSTTGSLVFVANTAYDKALLGTLAAADGRRITFDIYSDEACTCSVSNSGINVGPDSTTGEVYVSTDDTVSGGTYYVGLDILAGGSSVTQKVGKIAVVDSKLIFRNPQYDTDEQIIVDSFTGEPAFANVRFSTVINNADTEVVLLTGSDTTWGTADQITWYIADRTIDIESRVFVAGDVRLILCDGCELKVPKGITVSGDDNWFTVYAGGTADTIDGTGKLIIDCVGDGNAGIGGGGAGSGAGSNITINGGTVEATGGKNGAGIGGGYYGAGSNITINGGTVTSAGGENGAGIGGGGGCGEGSIITINGGTVTATGGDHAAGIGGGGGCGEGSIITINGGTVEATGGKNGAGIGGGDCGAGSNITINGGKVEATGGEKGAGIGGGDREAGSNITINGGTVTSTGGYGGAGIGGGSGGAGSGISINNCIIKAGDSATEGQIILKDAVTESDINATRYVFATSNLYTSTTESLGFVANTVNAKALLGTLAAVNEFNVTFGIYSEETCTCSALNSGINVTTDDTTGEVYVSTDDTVSGGTYYVGLVISAGDSSVTQKVCEIKVVIRLSSTDFTVGSRSFTYNGNTQKPAISCSDTQANVSYVLVDAATGKVVSSPVSAGTYNIFAAVAEENPYEGNLITYAADGVTYVSGGIGLGSFEIGRYTPQAADYQVSGTSVDYDGSAHQATVVRASLIQGIADEVYYVSKSGATTEFSSVTAAGTYEIRVRIQENGSFGQTDLLIGEMTVTQQTNPNPDGGQGGNQGGSQGGNQGGSQGGSQGGNQGGNQGGSQGGSQGGNSGNNNDGQSGDKDNSGSDGKSDGSSEGGNSDGKSEGGNSEGNSGGGNDGGDSKKDEPEYQSCSTISKTLGIDRPFDLGFSLPKGYTLQCSSSKPKVASVSEDGVITGLRAGKATITCSVMKGDKEVFTTVVSVKIKKGYKNGKAKASLKKTSSKYPVMNVYKLTKVGKTIDLSVENLPEGMKVSYKSADTKTVKVSRKGIITAKKKGWVSVTTTVKDENGKIVYKINTIMKVK